MSYAVVVSVLHAMETSWSAHRKEGTVYKVVRGDSAQALEYKVDCLRAQGYKFVGGVNA